jgi:hypothetical protein
MRVRAGSGDGLPDSSGRVERQRRPSNAATFVRRRTSMPAAQSLDAVYSPSAASNSGSSVRAD